MAGWIKAVEMAALPADGMHRVEIEGVPILLVNIAGQVRAYTGDCPHAGAPLDQGALCEGRIVCPWHKAVFAIDDGRWLEPPALEGLSTYPVRVEGDTVFVKLEPDRPRVVPIARADGGAARRFAIIGGGAAAAAAAATLLESDCDGEVTMFAAEPQAPYDRTCLSKFVPAGEMAPGEVPPILPEGVASDPRLRIEHVEVTHFDVATKRVTLADGRGAAFDAALIASGSLARRPDVPGASLGHVFTLRSLGDAAAILDALSPGEHAVILGDSFIGLETASALRKRGVEVTIAAPGGPPLQRVLGARVGTLLRGWHEANGVKFRHAKALRFEGSREVEAVAFDDGGTLHAKAVIAGIGVRPATQFASGIDLDEDGGIAVDGTMRAGPDVYAAGDIARFPLDSTGASAQRIRIEHWRVAQQQARIAALNMLGQDTCYEGVPFFWTEQYGKRFDYLGHAQQWDDLTVSGRPGDDRFVVLYAWHGRLLAALACGCEREMALLSERMREPLLTDSARAILGL